MVHLSSMSTPLFFLLSCSTTRVHLASGTPSVGVCMYVHTCKVNRRYLPPNRQDSHPFIHMYKLGKGHVCVLVVGCVAKPGPSLSIIVVMKVSP